VRLWADETRSASRATGEAGAAEGKARARGATSESKAAEMENRMVMGERKVDARGGRPSRGEGGDDERKFEE
jgi:hypothetical protein